MRTGWDSGPLPDGILRLTGFRQAWLLPPSWPDRMAAPGQIYCQLPALLATSPSASKSRKCR